MELGYCYALVNSNRWAPSSVSRALNLRDGGLSLRKLPGESLQCDKPPSLLHLRGSRIYHLSLAAYRGASKRSGATACRLGGAPRVRDPRPYARSTWEE